MKRFRSQNFVYGLWEPGTDGEIRYVGKTTMGAARFYAHLADKTRTHRGAWMRALKAKGKCFNVVVLERCSRLRLAEREQFWIRWCRERGFRLINATDGGEGPLGRIWTPEMRAKNAASNRGKKRSVESRERMSNAQKLLWSRPGHRERLSTSHRGHKCHLGHRHSEATKAQISRNRRATMAAEPERILRGERCAAAKMNTEKVQAIRRAHADGESQHSIALRFGLGDPQVSYIVRRKSWKHV